MDDDNIDSLLYEDFATFACREVEKEEGEDFCEHLQLHPTPRINENHAVVIDVSKQSLSALFLLLFSIRKTL